MPGIRTDYWALFRIWWSWSRMNRSSCPALHFSLSIPLLKIVLLFFWLGQSHSFSWDQNKNVSSTYSKFVHRNWFTKLKKSSWSQFVNSVMGDVVIPIIASWWWCWSSSRFSGTSPRSLCRLPFRPRLFQDKTLCCHGQPTRLFNCQYVFPAWWKLSFIPYLLSQPSMRPKRCS